MFRFEVQGVTVTDQAVSLHGVWDLGGTRRFQIVRVPVELFVADSVLEALCEIHSAPSPDPQHEWEQFLLWG